MKKQIDEIVDKTVLGALSQTEATEELLNLFSASISFVLEKLKEDIEYAEIDEIKSILKDLINEY